MSHLQKKVCWTVNRRWATREQRRWLSATWALLASTPPAGPWMWIFLEHLTWKAESCVSLKEGSLRESLIATWSDDKARHFWDGHNGDTSWKMGIPSRYKGKNRMTTHWKRLPGEVAQRHCGVSILADTQNSAVSNLLSLTLPFSKQSVIWFYYILFFKKEKFTGFSILLFTRNCTGPKKKGHISCDLIKPK